MVDEQVVGQLLRRHWGLADVRRLVRQPEAMNSLVWLAELGNGQRLVVKAASAREPLESGLRIAQAVQQRGIAAGAPWPARSGALTVPADGWAVAVLSFVAGRPIDPGRRQDAARWGALLGRLHRVLKALPVPAQADRWPWAWPAAGDDHLAAVPGLGAAVAQAVAAARRAVEQHRLSLGLLHADPAPSAFRLDGQDKVGVIDWGQAIWGPLLYDVGSAVVLQRLDNQAAHQDTFLDRYARTAAIPSAELEALETFVRLRWAVQAWWFSWRQAHNDQLGLQDPSGNQHGLTTAIQALHL
jgi:Ser/Thr protein kinase RdoA (MazF antagonist)